MFVDKLVEEVQLVELALEHRARDELVVDVVVLVVRVVVLVVCHEGERHRL